MKRKVFKTTLILAVAIFITFVVASPFKHDDLACEFRLVKSVETEATPIEAFTYLGNSSNAQRWSVFVEDITTLNESEVPDGYVGSKRRCYVKEGWPGKHWDEEILSVKENQARTLSIYNLTDFPVAMEGLRTEQLYERLPSGGCRVSLTLVKSDEGVSLFGRLKLKLAGYYIAKIFEGNLNRIKQELEINRR